MSTGSSQKRQTQSYLKIRIVGEKSNENGQDKNQFSIQLMGVFAGNKIAGEVAKQEQNSGFALGVYIPDLSVLERLFESAKGNLGCFKNNLLVISSREKPFQPAGYYEHPFNSLSSSKRPFGKGLLIKSDIYLSQGFLRQLGEFMALDSDDYLWAFLKESNSELAIAAGLTTQKPIRVTSNFLINNPEFGFMISKTDFAVAIQSDFILELDQGNQIEFTGGLYAKQQTKSFSIGGFLELKRPWARAMGIRNLTVNRATLDFNYQSPSTFNLGIIADVTVGNITGYGVMALSYTAPVLYPKVIAASVCDTDLAEVIEAFTGSAPPFAFILRLISFKGVEPWNRSDEKIAAHDLKMDKYKDGVTDIYLAIKHQIRKEKERGVKVFFADKALQEIKEVIKSDLEIKELLGLGEISDDDLKKLVVKRCKKYEESKEPEIFYKIEIGDFVREIKQSDQIFRKIDDEVKKEKKQTLQRVLDLEWWESEQIKKIFNQKFAKIKGKKPNQNSGGFASFRRGDGYNPKFKIPEGQEDRIYITKVKQKADPRNGNERTSVYYLADANNIYSIWPYRTSLNTQAMLALETTRIGSTTFRQGFEFFSHVIGADVGLQLQLDGNFLLKALAYSGDSKALDLDINSNENIYQVTGNSAIALILKPLFELKKIVEFVLETLKRIGEAILDALYEIGNFLEWMFTGDSHKQREERNAEEVGNLKKKIANFEIQKQAGDKFALEYDNNKEYSISAVDKFTSFLAGSSTISFGKNFYNKYVKNSGKLKEDLEAIRKQIKKYRNKALQDILSLDLPNYVKEFIGIEISEGDKISSTIGRFLDESPNSETLIFYHSIKDKITEIYGSEDIVIRLGEEIKADKISEGVVVEISKNLFYKIEAEDLISEDKTIDNKVAFVESLRSLKRDYAVISQGGGSSSIDRILQELKIYKEGFTERKRALDEKNKQVGDKIDEFNRELKNKGAIDGLEIAFSRVKNGTPLSKDDIEQFKDPKNKIQIDKKSSDGERERKAKLDEIIDKINSIKKSAEKIEKLSLVDMYDYKGSYAGKKPYDLSDICSILAFSSVATNSKITEIDLSNNNLGEVKAKAKVVAAAMQNYSGLKKLNLAANYFGNEGIKNFLKLIEDNKDKEVLGVIKKNKETLETLDPLRNDFINSPNFKLSTNFCYPAQSFGFAV